MVVFLPLRDHPPLKQGLRLVRIKLMRSRGELRDHPPLKQGLRQELHIIMT